jgi:hypothetical protein
MTDEKIKPLLTTDPANPSIGALHNLLLFAGEEMPEPDDYARIIINDMEWPLKDKLERIKRYMWEFESVQNYLTELSKLND